MPRWLRRIDWGSDWAVYGLAIIVVGAYILYLIGVWPWWGSEATVSPVSTVTPTAEPTLPSSQEVIAAIVTSLDAFWQEQLPRVDQSGLYVPPNLEYFDPDHVGEDVPCRRLLLKGSPALYCSGPQVVYLNTAFVERMESQRYGPTWLALALAHEWGHHITYLVDPGAPGQNEQDTIPLELQAYCASGLWARASIDAGEIPLSEIEAYMRALGRGETGVETHGTGAQRAAAFTDGFQGDGPRACGYEGL